MKSVDGRHVLDTIMAHKILGYMHTLLLMWSCLTDDGLQRVTQSRGETSSSLTDDGLDHGESLSMGSRWANKNLCHYELSKFRCRCEK